MPVDCDLLSELSSGQCFVEIFNGSYCSIDARLAEVRDEIAKLAATRAALLGKIRASPGARAATVKPRATWTWP